MRMITYSELKNAKAPKYILEYIERVFHGIDPWKPIWIYKVDADKLIKDPYIKSEPSAVKWLEEFIRPTPPKPDKKADLCDKCGDILGVADNKPACQNANCDNFYAKDKVVEILNGYKKMCKLYCGDCQTEIDHVKNCGCEDHDLSQVQAIAQLNHHYKEKVLAWVKHLRRLSYMEEVSLRKLFEVKDGN